MRFTRVTGFFAAIAFGGTLSSAAIDLNNGMDEYFIDRAIRALSSSNMARAYDTHTAKKSDGTEANWIDPEWLCGKWLWAEDLEDCDDDLYIKHYKDSSWNDDAIYIEQDGVCYVGFQMTENNIVDWFQNLGDGNRTLTNSKGNSCRFHDLIAGGLFPDYFDDLNGKVEDCVDKCDYDAHPDGCLVLGGHSQGGAIATVAHFVWDHLPHQTFVSGTPSVMKNSTDDCVMNYDNFYRFINSIPKKNTFNKGTDLRFDKVPYMMDADQSPFSDEKYPLGHFILISGHSPNTQAYYMGLNKATRLYPWDHSPLPLGLSHNLEILHPETEDELGYLQVLRNMRNRGKYPVSTKGFSSGAACSATFGNPSSFNMCESGECKATKKTFLWVPYDFRCS